MTFQTTLKKALNASDREAVNNYDIEGYHYPSGFDATVELIDVDDSRYEFDLDQTITVRDDGGALVTDVEGQQYLVTFEVIRPLCQGDLL